MPEKVSSFARASVRLAVGAFPIAKVLGLASDYIFQAAARIGLTCASMWPECSMELAPGSTRSRCCSSSCRGGGTELLIGAAINGRIESMIENASRPSSRIMDDDEVASLFGMEL